MYRKFFKIPRKAIALMIALGVMAAPIGYGQHWVQAGLRRLLYDHEASVSNIDEQSLGDYNSRMSESSFEYLRR